jgi:hypothetical protein
MAKIRLLAVGLLLSDPGVALAAGETEILVQGRRMSEREVRQEARSFVTTIAVPSLNDQYARWNAPICPVVQGLSPQHAKIVTDKIRSIAAEVGARVAKPVCDGNIVIVFTDDARVVYRKVAARNSQMFQSNAVEPDEHKVLSESDMPVRWWYGRALADVFGIAASPDRVPVAGGDFNSGGVMIYGGGSNIRSNVRVDQTAVAVLVDVKLAEGVRLDALAAYIGLVTLAAHRIPARPVAVPSIVNLFDAERAPETDLTEWDRAYLKALYKVPANLALAAQRAAISREMAANITRAAEEN